MNRLVIIGNGFDMAHGLNTSYMDFIKWYWEQRVNDLLIYRKPISDDTLCRLEIKNTKKYPDWYNYFHFNSVRDPFTREWKESPLDIIEKFKKNEKEFSVKYSNFFERIMNSFNDKRWVDIENDYYEILKKSIEDTNYSNTVEDLNKQLDFLRNELVKYLSTIGRTEPISSIKVAIKEALYTKELSSEGKRIIRSAQKSKKEHLFLRDYLYVKRTMLLCFNYTETVEMYDDNNIIVNYIHGNLRDPEHIVFGYGDELDKDYPTIREKNDNELLKNVKSVKYLETSNYRKMLDFIEAAPFQVLIMGHSCGNSDRTLLNTVFEHENCISIKPYYHQREDGNDNYLEIVQNISRNFTNPKLFRDRVVNKEQCQTM